MSPREAMLLAIEEGKKGAGFVSPNPLVGCVILDRQFNLISKGYHARVGEGHAEAEALRAVRESAALDGAHVYVTLEPCAHEARTPSCAKALAKLPIASVTYGLQDPNPLVSGKGAEILAAAGKNVSVFGDLKCELEELCEIFLINMRARRPFIALKAAISLDGKIAYADGTSKWISGEASRLHVQYLRGCYDAVLAGAGTFISDDPRLNSRDPRFSEKRQRVVLLDPEGRCFSRLTQSALLSVRPPADVIVVTAVEPPSFSEVQVIQSPAPYGEFDLLEVLGKLREAGIHSLFVEGGAATYSAFLRSGIADRLYLYIAPKIIGKGLSWMSEELVTPSQLKFLRSETFGEDILLSGRLT